MSAEILVIAGVLTLVALTLAVATFGLLHFLQKRIEAMSLSNPLLVEIVDAVKAEAGALLARAEKAETDLADALLKNSAFEAEVADLKSELAAIFNPAHAAAEPAAEAPAA